jgi:fructose-1,6-bisphosphatase
MVSKENIRKRILTKDTDTGRALQLRIDALKLLIDAYRTGLISQS